MALTALQRSICRLLAATRFERESYVAGGTALNEILRASRRSRDLDLFHDSAEAVAKTSAHDITLLSSAGFRARIVREAPSYVEATISDDAETTLVQWLQDSAFRFFPLVRDDEFGLSLHPFDLATNKVLAMAGRLEARDWIDVIHCHRHLQPLGYLVWAACGKDPGYSPMSLLQEMRRSSKYSQTEIDLLDFDGGPPSARELGVQWHGMLREAPEICDILPVEQIGTCVVSDAADLLQAGPKDLAEALSTGVVRFHRGTIGGAWPTFPRTR